MKYIISITISLVLLVGCSTMSNTTRIESFDMEKLRQIDAYVIAQDYAKYRKDRAAAAGKSDFQRQLETRFYTIVSDVGMAQLEQVMAEKGLPSHELVNAREGRIFIGMTRLGLYASWGRPHHENRTVTSRSVSIQHIYGDFGPYVYTRDDLVTSWQD